MADITYTVVNYYRWFVYLLFSSCGGLILLFGFVVWFRLEGGKGNRRGIVHFMGNLFFGWWGEDGEWGYRDGRFGEGEKMKGFGRSLTFLWEFSTRGFLVVEVLEKTYKFFKEAMQKDQSPSA